MKRFSSDHRCTSPSSPPTLWLSADTSSSPASESGGAVRTFADRQCVASVSDVHRVTDVSVSVSRVQ